MANQQADGKIIIDTQIDSKGFEADSKEMRQAVKQLGSKMESLGPVFQKAVSGNASALSTFKGKADTLRDTISSIEDKMAEIADKEYPLQEYTRATAEIEKTQQALEKLKAKEQELKASGKDIGFSDEYKAVSDAELKAIQQVEKLQEKLNNTSIRSPKHSALESQIEQLKAEIAQYKQAKADMARDGSALQESQEWQKVQSELEITRNDLAQLQAQKQQLENSGQTTVKGVDTQTYKEMDAQLQKSKSKLGEINKKVSKANSFAAKLKGAFSKVAGVVGAGLKKGMTAFIGKIKSAHKASDGMHKKFLKMGLALIGMRGLMGGIRQLVSSAMSNNEQLQKQLTAVKGVLGQAFMPAITALISGLSQAVTLADRLYQIFTGTSLIAKYNAQQLSKQAKSTKESAKQADKQLASFDDLTVLSDNSKSDSDNNDDTALFEPANLSSSMQDFVGQFKELWSDGNFEGIGTLVSSKIVDALQGIDWENIKKKAFNGGKSFAETLNGLFKYSDEDGNTLMSSIGKTIGESFNTLLSAVDGFASNLDWADLGFELANGISTAITTIDWKLLFKTAIDLGEGFGDYINGIFEYKDKDGNSLAKNLGTGLSNAIHAAFLFVTSFLETINWQNIGKAIADFIQGIDWVQLMDDLVTLISDLLVGALDVIIGFLEGIDWGKAVDDLFAMIGKLFTSVDWTRLAEQLSQILGDLIGAACRILAQITIDVAEFVQKIIDSITGYFSQYFSWDDTPENIIKGLLQGIWDACKNIGQWIMDHIVDPFIEGVCKGFGIQSPSKKMAEIGGYLVAGLKNGIGNVWNKIKEKFSTMWTNVKEWFDTKKENFKSKGSEIVNSIKNGIGNIWNSVKTKFSAFWTGIKEWFEGKVNDFKAKGTEIITNIKNGIGNIWNDIKEKFSTFWSDIKKWFENKKTDFEGKGTEIITNIKNGVGNVWNSIKEKFSTFWSDIKKWFDDKVEDFKGLGKNIIDGIKDGVGGNFDNVTSSVKGAVGGLVDKIKDFLGIHSPSRVFRDEIGKFIALGVGAGITGNIHEVVRDVATLSGAIQNELNNKEYAIQPISANGTNVINAGLDSFAEIITESFTQLIDKLESIARGVNFTIPAAVNIVPYKSSENSNEELLKLFQMSNDELISVLAQLFNNQTSAIVSAVQNSKVTTSNPTNYNKLTSAIIDEINRRKITMGESPI